MYAAKIQKEELVKVTASLFRRHPTFREDLVARVLANGAPSTLVLGIRAARSPLPCKCVVAVWLFHQTGPRGIRQNNGRPVHGGSFAVSVCASASERDGSRAKDRRRRNLTDVRNRYLFFFLLSILSIVPSAYLSV
ncbi:hypothetical protein GWI33_005310 [Rhynchophorus ferrugineus]|uniref:Uncharacterized protein n=1 Tax=Rhynchophorus ferrugineus TaxID=354439 RepID=A0A834IHN5_RHYFE|nr:hypothetical protein GWI33_005310 [Rhynchophorus ferrugineus]